MAKFKIMMTCFSADPSIRPYEERIARYFSGREEAEDAVEKCVADELETLNGGEAEGEFIGNFESEAHAAIVEFWEGEPTEGDRDMRYVTIYDIVELKEDKTEHRYSWSIDDHNTMTVWEDDAVLATLEDCYAECEDCFDCTLENLFKEVVYEMRGVNLDKG